MKWGKCTIDNVCELISGVTFSKSEGVTNKKEDLIPIIRAGNIQKYLELDEDLIYVPKSKVKEKQMIRKNDIIMCTSSGSSKVVGKSAISNVNWQGSFGAFNIGIRPKENISPKYLYFYLQSPVFSNWTLLSTGANIKNIRSSELRLLQIPLPPLETQKKMAAILDKADSIRKKRREAIEKLDELLKSVFLDMFGDPVTNPKGWPVKKLGELMSSVKNGITRRRKIADNIGQVVLRLRDIKANHIDYSELNRIPLKEDELEKFNIEYGDFLFIRVNGNPDYVGRCASFLGYNEPVFFNDHIMRVRFPIEQLNPIFLSYLLNSDYGRSEILRHRKTSAGQHTINQDGLSKVSIYTPVIDKQNKFSTTVNRIENIKQTMQQELDQADNLFNSLMQKAFNGELE